MLQRSQLFWPVNILVGFIVLIGLMFASAAVTPLNVFAIDPLYCPTNGPAQQPNPYPPYPECVANRAPLLTGTALAQNPVTNTPTVENNNNNTNPAPTNTPTPTPTATNGVAAEATPTFTSTPTQTTGAVQPTAEALPSPTPTTILPDGVDARICIPGELLEITGAGEPGTALIVTFADRPVGGGSVRNDGTYRIALRIGPERPGVYLVEVEERDSRLVLQEFACEVPAVNGSPMPDLSPTPTPFAGNA
jgi:hypothetical protein